MGCINTQLISESEGNVLGRTLLTAISEYFADPEHQEQFEQWKINRKEVEKCKRKN